MAPANKSEKSIILSIIISNQTSFIHSFTQLNARTCMYSFLRFLSNCKELEVTGYIVPSGMSMVADNCHSSKAHKFVNFRSNFNYFALEIK